MRRVFVEKSEGKSSLQDLRLDRDKIKMDLKSTGVGSGMDLYDSQ
jgi:hypothetical protein